MGTDIHICIQVQNDNGEWSEIPYHRELYPHEIEEGRQYPEGIPIAPYMLTGRSYNAFAILADVRNGSGFARIKTGDGWPSISSGRGWPAGFDRTKVFPDPRYVHDGDSDSLEPRYMGDHSYTWVMLSELKAYGWDDISTRLYGVISAQQYEKMREVGTLGMTPEDGWSGAVTGPGITTFTQTQWERERHRYLPLPEIRDKRLGMNAKQFIQVSWDETARAATGDYPGKVIPFLEKLAAGRPLRLVLGFDS